MPTPVKWGCAGKSRGLGLAAVAIVLVAGAGPPSAGPFPWQKVGQAAQLINSDFVRPTNPQDLEKAAMRGLWSASRRSGPMPVAEGTATGDFTAFDRLAGLLCHPDRTATPLIDGAIQAMTGTLGDPYSRYLDAAAFRHFKEDRAGRFAGIGVRVGVLTDGPHLVSVLAGGSASKAGLREGDRLQAVDGLAVAGLSAARISERLRGATGSPVTVRLQRAARVWQQTLVRRPLLETPVRVAWLPDRLAYVRLASFASTRSVADLRQALSPLAARHPAGLVLDLRHNPGGDLDVARDMAGLFLKDSVMVVMLDRSGTLAPLRSRGVPVVPTGLPLAVLIDGHSASAAEILAVALRDGRHARLTGEPSFGKGCIQVTQGLNDGTALVLTTRLFFTADGKPLHGVGVVPHVTVAHPPGQAYDLRTDATLQAAIRDLRGRRSQQP